jgi:hypothetical protein
MIDEVTESKGNGANLPPFTILTRTSLKKNNERSRRISIQSRPIPEEVISIGSLVNVEKSGITRSVDAR